MDTQTLGAIVLVLLIYYGPIIYNKIFNSFKVSLNS